jgi:hypothetical protein
MADLSADVDHHIDLAGAIGHRLRSPDFTSESSLRAESRRRHRHNGAAIQQIGGEHDHVGLMQTFVNPKSSASRHNTSIFRRVDSGREACGRSASFRWSC